MNKEDEVSFGVFVETLINAEDISPDVRFLLMYFKYNQQFGDVKTVHVLEKLKPYWGTTRVRNAMNQALAAGYMAKEEFRIKLRGCALKYHVDCKPSFESTVIKLDMNGIKSRTKQA